MTGISEILVLILLIACILILPRMFKSDDDAESFSKIPIKFKKMKIKTRIGIVLSIAYPFVTALYLKPWEGHLSLYISWGLFPVLIAWGFVWILAGKTK